MPQPLTRAGIAACAICRKQLTRSGIAKNAAGLKCHARCLPKPKIGKPAKAHQSKPSAPSTAAATGICALCRRELDLTTAVRTAGQSVHRRCLTKKPHQRTQPQASKPKAAGRVTVTRVDPAVLPQRRQLATSPFATQAPALPCAVCGEPKEPRDRLTETGDGWVHERCADIDPAPYKGSGAKAFQRNKESIESGKTFAGQKASDWRVGASPSAGGERRH